MYATCMTIGLYICKPIPFLNSFHSLIVARAFANAPELLLVDEGLSSCPPDQAARILGRLGAERRSFGLTTIVVTNDAPAVHFVDRLHVLHKGDKGNLFKEYP